MHLFYWLISLLLLLDAIAEEPPLNFDDCLDDKSRAATEVSVTVSGCEKIPCSFLRSTQHTVNITFEPAYEVEFGYVTTKDEIIDQTVEPTITTRDRLGNFLQCPLKPDKDYSISLNHTTAPAMAKEYFSVMVSDQTNITILCVKLEFDVN